MSQIYNDWTGQRTSVSNTLYSRKSFTGLINKAGNINNTTVPVFQGDSLTGPVISTEKMVSQIPQLQIYEGVKSNINIVPVPNPFNQEYPYVVRPSSE